MLDGLSIDDAISAVETELGFELNQYQYDAPHDKVAAILVYMQGVIARIQELRAQGILFNDVLKQVESERNITFSEAEALWLLANMPG